MLLLYFFVCFSLHVDFLKNLNALMRFFRKIKGANCRHSQFEARNESPMMRKCEFRMQENPKLLQSEFERSEALGLGPKYSNLSPAH